jgi:hypothetical protein
MCTDTQNLESRALKIWQLVFQVTVLIVIVKFNEMDDLDNNALDDDAVCEIAEAEEEDVDVTKFKGASYEKQLRTGMNHFRNFLLKNNLPPDNMQDYITIDHLSKFMDFLFKKINKWATTRSYWSRVYSNLALTLAIPALKDTDRKAEQIRTSGKFMFVYM